LRSISDKDGAFVGTFVRSVAGATIVLLATACVTPKDFDTGGAIRAVQASGVDLATPKTVYFATTRCKEDPSSGASGTKEELFSKRCWDENFKNEEMLRLGFGMADSGKVTCGSATVSVMPPNADDKAATTVGAAVSIECGSDFATLRQAVLNTPCRCALIFVHGYNTTFAFGVKRMAQLALDLSYEGAPILFSFAAAGRFGDYVNDTEAGELASPALHRLLVALTRSDAAGAPAIDVIAHSMGARLTLRSINESNAPALRYVVLAAPDIDTTAFLHLADKAAPHAQRLTVYTSKFDVAMSASTSMHSGRPRVGEGLSALAARDLSGTEIIDATERATDPYAHSYFAESKVMVDDIRAVLAGKPAPERKRLICSTSGPQSVIACKMPCPEEAKCGPSFYQRTLHWLLD
jgi:esterase/lipase superfamily enzyme